MESPVDSQSLLVVVLGPVTIAALVGAFLYWLQRRKPPAS